MALAELLFEIGPAAELHFLPMLFVFGVDDHGGVVALDYQVGNQ